MNNPHGVSKEDTEALLKLQYAVARCTGIGEADQLFRENIDVIKRVYKKVVAAGEPVPPRFAAIIRHYGLDKE